jgi:hypothetical protein
MVLLGNRDPWNPRRPEFCGWHGGPIPSGGECPACVGMLEQPLPLPHSGRARIAELRCWLAYPHSVRFWRLEDRLRLLVGRPVNLLEFTNARSELPRASLLLELASSLGVELWDMGTVKAPTSGVERPPSRTAGAFWTGWDASGFRMPLEPGTGKVGFLPAAPRYPGGRRERFAHRLGFALGKLRRPFLP